MPKYKNGREAKVGDRVFFSDRQGRLSLGKVTAIEADKPDTLRVLPFTDAQPVLGASCIHADDHNGGAAKPATAPAPVVPTVKPEPDLKPDEIESWDGYQFTVGDIRKMVKHGQITIARAVKLETAQGEKARQDVIAALTESNGG